MAENTPIIVYTAECIGNAANCLYPNEVKITDEFSAKLAFATDMVCARYKNNYRNTANFEVANALPGDCDNDHSDEPADWVTPEDIADLFADVSYVLHFSRHHMKPKGEKGARPRFHIVFLTDPEQDADRYTALKQRLLTSFPFFDANAMDAARFLFGTEDPQVIYHPGTITLNAFLDDLENEQAFEEQSIDTATADGELMLSILASYAQEESLSASENQKWRVKRNFEEGIPWRFFMLGYRRENGKLTVIPEEAEIVRSIFDDYLAGKGVTAIAKRLNESGYATQSGCVFHKSAVERILRNYAYTGNLLLQTKFRENHLTKVTRKNQGELPQYHATDTHEAIIPLETFNAVQAEIRRRKEKYAPAKPQQISPFTGLITCAICGKHYRRKTTATGPVWICSTYNSYGKSCCPSKAIPEEKLMQTAAQVGHTGEITAITAHNDNLLEFTLKDGNAKHPT